MADTPSGKQQVNISQDLYDQIKTVIQGKGFSTVDDYVTYVLRVTLGKKTSSSSEQSADDEKVMKQLKSLGYI